MSSPDAFSPPPPHHPSGPLDSPGGDVGGFGGQSPEKPNQFNSHSHPEDVAPFKRPKKSTDNLPEPGTLSPKNPMPNPPNIEVGKGTGHIFYKTLICRQFLAKTCQKGELCTFAHGPGDLREPPPNWRDRVREKYEETGKESDEHKFIQRMKLCRRYYYGGMCPYGDQCIFQHERAVKFNTDMASHTESSAISTDTTRSGSGSDNRLLKDTHIDTNSEAFQVRPAFWKTRICNKWEMTGECPYGKICHFAHGSSDLKAPGGGDIQAKPVVQSDSDLPSNALPSASIEKKEQEERDRMKDILKWKLNKKITGVYADWLDGYNPPESIRKA